MRFVVTNACKLILLATFFCGICNGKDCVDMGHIKTDGVCLYYEEYGQGRPILLIAGLASDSQSWATVISHLSENHRVVIFDNRGIGRSTPQDVSTSISKICDDAVTLLEYLGIESADIIGHSMGGFVALDMAIRYPSRVNKLIVVASSAKINDNIGIIFDRLATELEDGIDLRVWFREVFDLIFTQKLLSDNDIVKSMLDYSVDYPYPQTPQSFRNQIEAIGEFDCTALLDRVKSPTLLICGAEDILFTPSQSTHTLETIEGIRTIIIDGAAHSVHVEKPEEFSENVLEFIMH